MLCEKCQKRNATVHVTEVPPGSGESKKHDFCESCYSESDIAKKVNTKTAGWTSDDPPQSVLPDDEPNR
jgi:protein-arginine kinase activator protein McsA